MAGGGSWLPRGASQFAARLHMCRTARAPVITGHERHCPTPTPVSTSVARNVLARTGSSAARAGSMYWQQRAGSMYWQQRSAATRLCLNCRVVAGIRSCNTRERECLQPNTALLEPI